MTTEDTDLERLVQAARSAIERVDVPEERSRGWSETARVVARHRVFGAMFGWLFLAATVLVAVGYTMQVGERGRLADDLDLGLGWGAP